MEKCKYKRANDVEKSLGKSTVAVKKSPWNNLFGKLRVLLPYLWPDNTLLQIRVILCVILVISLRVINVFLPRLQRDIIDVLALHDGSFPFDLILYFTGLKILQGGPGFGRFGSLINTAKNFLWIRVQQHNSKKLKLKLFNNLHQLGVRWHHSRKTGEVLRVMDRGTAAVTTVLNTAFFQIVPIIADVFIAMGALSYDLNIYFGLIIFGTMIIYLIVAVIGTEYRTKFKRKMNDADNEQRSRSVDSLLNSETVKLYGNEQYESDQFSHYMDKYQDKEWKSDVIIYIFNMCQNLTLNCGLLAGSLYCAYLISQKQLTVGDFVLFSTYMLQLTHPFNQLSMFYRTIQEALINMEHMFDLMNEEREVEDVLQAPNFNPSQTDIVLENVSFHYNLKQPILKNISLKVAQGSSLAIVGPSGSGKSTLIKLLLRFFDPIEGKILIGNQNISLVQQTSLRQNIGVVPQDTVLFNDTVDYNIKYGRIGASTEEAENACKVAEVHDRIMNLPDTYQTKVGERGMKLSGGEKQRIAIARTLLRSPKIIILDEATSSLDTATEKNIQNALSEVCKNRTSVIVAHRLSTIQDADQIIVLQDGEIIESGNHNNLIAQKGKYYEMWNLQQIQP